MAEVATTVGFIGMGAMGLPMALHLVRRGHPVRGFDVTEQARAAFAEGGGEAVAGPAEAAGDVALLVLIVATAAQADNVLFGEAGVAPHGRRRHGHPPQHRAAGSFAEAIGARLAESGHPFLDAPISGGQVGAEAGKLTVMASGMARPSPQPSRSLAA